VKQDILFGMYSNMKHWLVEREGEKERGTVRERERGRERERAKILCHVYNYYVL
jgi:hypothetical protein